MESGRFGPGWLRPESFVAVARVVCGCLLSRFSLGHFGQFWAGRVET